MSVSCRPQRRLGRGVSLIEALIALLIVGMGLLGVLAMQATLHRGAELARQGSAALRGAQSALEAWRTALARNPGHSPSQAEEGLEGPDSMAESTPGAPIRRTTAFSDDGTGLRTVRVNAQWEDRAGQPHQLQLTTAVALLPGELSASLLRQGGPPVRQPLGRHPTVPRAAIDLGNGTSAFTPPSVFKGSAPPRWIIDHAKGLVTVVCDGASCTAAHAALLSGHIGFEHGLSAPPRSPPTDLQVSVRLTAPAAQLIDCPTQPALQGLSYHCLLPMAPGAQGGWSGRVLLSRLPLALTLDDARADVWRVCRYTPVRDAHPAVDGKRFTNRQHPLDYHGVTESLAGQNFLVLRAGDGLRPADCPPDDPSTPQVNDNTWHHQPSG